MPLGKYGSLAFSSLTGDGDVEASLPYLGRGPINITGRAWLCGASSEESQEGWHREGLTDVILKGL